MRFEVHVSDMVIDLPDQDWFAYLEDNFGDEEDALRDMEDDLIEGSPLAAMGASINIFKAEA